MGDAKKRQELLKHLFLSKDSPVAFTSATKVYEYLRHVLGIFDISLRYVRRFERTHVRPNQIIRNGIDRFPRLRTFANDLNHIWQLDLVDLHAHPNSRYNKFILSKIDVFSRQADAVLLANKSASAVLRGFKKILDNVGVKPHKVHTDEGKEFFNSLFSTFCRENRIHHYKTDSEMKAAMVERFNRSLQTKLYRIIMYNKSKGVRESLAIILERVIKDHNALKHSATGIAPKDITPVVSGKLLPLQNQHRKNMNLGRKSGFRFKIGDHVRITRQKTPFHKAYRGTFSKEVFVVRERRRRWYNVPVNLYRLKDLTGESLKGVFYEQQLYKVVLPMRKTVEKVWKRDKKGNVFVSFLDHPKKHFLWLNKNEFARHR